MKAFSNVESTKNRLGNIIEIAANLPSDFVEFQVAADIEKDMRLNYSLWLFKDAHVTLSKAAELAEMGIYAFISACKQNDVHKQRGIIERTGRDVPCNEYRQ